MRPTFGDFLRARRALLTTMVEILGAVLIVAGVAVVFGPGIALIVAGAFAIGIGYLEGRKV